MTATADSGFRIVEVEYPVPAGLVRRKGKVAVYRLWMIRRSDPPGSRGSRQKKMPPAPHAGVEEVTCVLRPAERTG